MRRRHPGIFSSACYSYAECRIAHLGKTMEVKHPHHVNTSGDRTSRSQGQHVPLMSSSTCRGPPWLATRQQRWALPRPADLIVLSWSQACPSIMCAKRKCMVGEAQIHITIGSHEGLRSNRHHFPNGLSWSDVHKRWSGSTRAEGE